MKKKQLTSTIKKVILKVKKFNKELKIVSATENLSLVRDFTKTAAEDSGFANDVVAKIVLAVDEACTNIIKHAYKYSVQGEIVITASLENSKFTITLTDSGAHFDSKTIPEPDLEKYAKERKVGGLGMFLMKKLMDEVTYHNLEGDSNQVTMVKYI